MIIIRDLKIKCCGMIYLNCFLQRFFYKNYLKVVVKYIKIFIIGI